ncbi:MAG: MFS transporter [Chloroflexi bacterium]|nr:MFS transporter [Chloroflexota bacterium]
MTSSLSRSVFLVALAHLTIELCGNFLPVIYAILINTLGLTYSQIGVIALVVGLSEALTQPFFGFLSDRWGAERMMVLSIAWMGVLLGLVGFTWDYLSLVLLVGLGVLGSAAFHPAGATLASARGGNMGSALSPLLVATGISWLGLPGTTILIPVALLVSLILHWEFGRDRYATQDHLIGHQAQHHPQGFINTTAKVGLALIVVVVMCRSWVQVAFMTYLPEWIQSQGGSLTLGGQMLALFSIATGVGSLTGGSLSDRIGRWQVFTLSMSLLGPAMWLFLNVAGLWQVGLVAIIGILIGLSFPVAMVMAQETWPRGVGLASALVMGVGWAPGGLGASFTGLVADHYSLATGLGLLMFPPLLGLACILAYATLQRRSVRVVSSDVAG